MSAHLLDRAEIKIEARGDRYIVTVTPPASVGEGRMVGCSTVMKDRGAPPADRFSAACGGVIQTFADIDDAIAFAVYLAGREATSMTRAISKAIRDRKEVT